MGQPQLLKSSSANSVHSFTKGSILNDALCYYEFECTWPLSHWTHSLKASWGDPTNAASHVSSALQCKPAFQEDTSFETPPKALHPQAVARHSWNPTSSSVCFFAAASRVVQVEAGSYEVCIPRIRFQRQSGYTSEIQILECFT